MTDRTSGRVTILSVGAVYAVVVIVLRWNHIGDVAHEIALADRLLRGESLYGTWVPGQGSLWPPFAAVFLVPFALIARLDVSLAAGVWSLVGVACLVTSVLLASRWGYRVALLALLAIAMPVQTNFEHHNVNTILLLFVMAGLVDTIDRRDTRAGIWFGVAAALKAFPALLLVYLALRRRWRALAAGLITLLVATALPLLPYGPAGALAELRGWLAVGLDQSQWQLAISDQSVRALATRLGAGPTLAVALSVIPLGLLVVAARRRTHDLAGIGAAALAAVLASPIAWVHYYVLAYPAWVAALSRTTAQRVLVLPAVLTSGLLTAGRGPVRRALLGASAYAWGGLLLLGLVATMQPPAATPAPATETE